MLDTSYDDICILRNGKKVVVLRNDNSKSALVDIRTGVEYLEENYDASTWKHDEDENLDVMEVYHTTGSYTTRDVIKFITGNITFEKFKGMCDCTYKRAEVKKMTVAEINKALGYEVEIVKG
jgi:hypothetical protein